VGESLEDQLRRATRNFTARLPEDQVFALGRDLALELARAHAESPPRFPGIEPSRIAMESGRPRLPGGESKGSAVGELLELGALLHSLAAGVTPDVSWRLDGPPPAEASSLRRRAVLAALASPLCDVYATASAAASALERALHPEPPGSAPWPLFRGTPTRAGTGPTSLAPPAGLGALWHAPLGAVVSSPLLTPDLVIALSADGRLVFLDRGTGTRIHEAKLASALESSPALLDRNLVLGTDDGEVLAIDTRDGRILYRVRLGEVVRSSPLPSGDRVLVGAVEGKGMGSLVALEVSTGKTLWKRRLGPVFSSPALAGGLVLVGSDDERLYALTPERGEVAWSLPLSGRVRATPAVLGDTAVVADFKGRVVAVKAADGSVRWTQELKEPVYSSAALTPALAVLGCHDGRVYGLALETGEKRFELPTGGPVVSSPVALPDRFLAASTDGQLYLIDAEGRTLAKLAVAAEGIQSSPALDEHGVVIGSGRGLHAFRLTS
jgi:outer membrane protein assembly factor BamB